MMVRLETVTMIVAHIRDNFTAAFFPRWAEWSAAFVLLGIGMMLSVNTNLMVSSVANGYGKGYEFLLEIAGQSVWATTLTVFGSFRLAILLINGAWRRSPIARAVMAFLSCFFWTQLVLSFQPTFGFAFVMACGWLLTDIVNIMRAARDARTVNDVLARGKGSGLD
ncbi:hypothetical protein EFV37_29095 [Mesorhizobium loti]|uniref:Uncharacterized protein n=2 Tax=Mesorhizobium jarvisii TaxID=1777867 RepID=A0A6M7TM70_9HYPH|nr:hypothetical protein A9K72_11945 [Mesorhizobium loti]QKC65860.1 hypothetical protein EB229_29085 [Mesorhizobium jarvisii]QKD11774.1 hypothetical protein EFV37_29095 [Mesorhizobium loti]RJT37880.1 hypothetical protein D3242_01140 [Mesorhizobium jarvisii]